MPKIDIDALAVSTQAFYPAPFDAVVKGRSKIALGDGAGLTKIGVNLTRLLPGASTALRHWHDQEDEMVIVLSGTLVLVEEDGETALGPGDCAGFAAGVANGHYVVNRSDAPAVIYEIGNRARNDDVEYPDDDMRVEKRDGHYHTYRKDGSAYFGGFWLFTGGLGGLALRGAQLLCAAGASRIVLSSRSGRVAYARQGLEERG